MVDDVYVTPEGANKILQQVTVFLEQARASHAKIIDILVEHEFDQASLLQAGKKEELRELSASVREALDGIESLGGYVKDLDVGLVDFLSSFEGRDIFLCWKLGEQRVVHWHEIDEGFSGRQKILDLDVLVG